MQEQLDRIESKLDFLICLLTEEDEAIELPTGHTLDEPATL